MGAVKDFVTDVREQIGKSHKMRDTARLLYYKQLLEGNGVAAVSYEQFKGSWAHEQWLKKYGDHIACERDTKNRRFGWIGQWT